MDYQTRLLTLLDATGLHHLTVEQHHLITWAARSLDPATADTLADLFQAIRIDAFRVAIKRGLA